MMKTVYSLVALATIAVVSFVSKNLSEPSSATPSAEPVIHQADSIQALPADAVPIDIKAYQAELDRRRSRFAADSSLSLKSLTSRCLNPEAAKLSQ